MFGVHFAFDFAYGVSMDPQSYLASMVKATSTIDS